MNDESINGIAIALHKRPKCFVCGSPTEKISTQPLSSPYQDKEPYYIDFEWHQCTNPKCMALQHEKRIRTDNMGNWIENPIYWRKQLLEQE
jgi:hypothetical protein